MLTAMNLNQYSIDAAQPRLAVERSTNLHVLVPSKQEQEHFVAHISSTIANIDASSAWARRQIELLQECWICIVADVVPGKLDVGEAALEMPEEPAREVSMDTNGPMADNERAGLKPVPTSTAYVWYDSNRQPEER